MKYNLIPVILYIENMVYAQMHAVFFKIVLGSKGSSAPL